eukprot:jgi/Mesen1/9706/ME000069S09105
MPHCPSFWLSREILSPWTCTSISTTSLSAVISRIGTATKRPWRVSTSAPKSIWSTSLSYICSDFPKDCHACRIPVSPTVAQLAGLQRLHISISNQHQSGLPPLPPWLAEVPAFVKFGYQIGRNSSPRLLMDSLRVMTGLQELLLIALEEDCNVVSCMSQLTSLVLALVPARTPPAASELLLLSTHLVKLAIRGNNIPQNETPLPHLEDLSLDIGLAIQPNYFAFTRHLRSLRLAVRKELEVWPCLEYLTQLTSLSRRRAGAAVSLKYLG